MLTPRETEIAGLLAAGSTDKEIGGKLGISEHTVNSHLRRLFAKLRVNNRVGAAVAYVTRISGTRTGE